MSIKSQSGIQLFLFAILLMFFFILGVAVFFQGLNENSNPNKILSSATVYTSKGVDCYSQEVQFHWNDQQLQECLANKTIVNSS